MIKNHTLQPKEKKKHLNQFTCVCTVTFQTHTEICAMLVIPLELIHVFYLVPFNCYLISLYG